MPTLASDIPDATAVTAPLDVLVAWLSQPDTRQRLQAAVVEAAAAVEQHILSDTSLRVPRQREDREDGFRRWLDASVGSLDQWLRTYKHQLAQRIQSEVLNALPEVFVGVRNKDMIREIVETSIWPQVEPQLRRRAEDLLVSYAVRGIALAWTCRNVGDDLLLGLPEETGQGWRVPVYRPGVDHQVAFVALDQNGEIVSDAEAMQAEVESRP